MNFMYEWVESLRVSDLPGSAKAVGLWASRYADYETGADVRPSLARLVEDSGYSRNTVKDALALLTEEGFLELAYHGGGGPKDPNRWNCVLPDKGSAVDPIRGQSLTGKGSVTDSKGSTTDPNHSVPLKDHPKTTQAGGPSGRQALVEKFGAEQINSLDLQRIFDKDRESPGDITYQEWLGSQYAVAAVERSLAGNVVPFRRAI